MAAMENENDNTAGYKLRLHPSLRDVTEKHSNRMLIILVAKHYVVDPTKVLEFARGKYDDGVQASAVYGVYGVYDDGKLVDIGSSKNLTNRIKTRKEKCGDDWPHCEIRCIVYMDGIDLETDVALQRIYVEIKTYLPT